MNVKFLDDFEAIGEKAWDALLARSASRSICRTWAWQNVWWQAYGRREGRKLYLVAAYEDRDLRVVMPLMLDAGVLRFVGDGSAESLDLIYDAGRPQDIAGIFVALKGRGDWQEIRLNALADDSPTWRFLKILSQDAGLFPLSVNKSVLWRLQLEGREDRLRRLLQAGTVAKHAAILGTKGKVRAVHAPAPPLKDIPWREMFIQHIHRWALGPEPSLFVERASRDFYHGLAADKALHQAMVFTTLFLNDRPLAYHLGLMKDGVFYVQLLSFDIVFRRFSPDDVLWRELVSYALAHSCREIVFVSSGEPCVRRYGERSGTARDIRIFRSRREQVLKKCVRWLGKVPLAHITARVCCSLGEILAALLQRRRVVEQERRRLEGVDSFQAFYARSEGAFRPLGLIPRPEVELLRRLRPELKELRVLDAGIGCGPTGIYFALAVKAYMAFGFSGSRTARAGAWLDDEVAPAKVFAGDPRAMGFSSGGDQDLILFTGNGIDEFPEEDRVRIFREVQRVGRPGAWFFFSSRNLQSLAPGPAFGLLDLLRRVRRRILMMAANKDLQRLQHQPYAMLLDEAGGYRLPVHYGTPREQVRVLKELGFHDVKVFSSRTGLEVRDWRRWDKLRDDAVYYLCRV